jgi:hypothetical protein
MGRDNADSGLASCLKFLEEKSGSESLYYRMTLRDLQSKTAADATSRAA